MTDLRSHIYIEIDIKYCSLSYGNTPCTAALGVTGSDKCFNTRNRGADCQDPANFTESTKTLRFGLRDRPIDPDIDCIPLLEGASVQNAVVEPGVSIGERATLTARFSNSPHGDAGVDKYITDRSYNPFEQGTFWGKFRARNTYLESRPIRIYRGYLGQSLAEMDCEHFVIDKMVGPDAGGRVTITGVDFMQLLNSEKAQAPTPNNGVLDADITDTETAITLLPASVGDEYPDGAQSTLAVLGKELVTITNRTGDDFTITRGADAEAHDAGEVLQLALVYTSQDVATIAEDLIVNYSPLDSSYVDSTAWAAIVSQFVDVLYSRTIPKPTPVVELLNELIESVGLVMFGDTRTQQIEFDVLRPNPTTGLAIGPDEVLRDSFRQVDQPKKRYSQIWVFYGKRDIFEDDEPTNYYSAVIYPLPDVQYETPSIKKIFSKWIPASARSVATDVAVRAGARYQFPPRRLMFSLFAQNTRGLGQVVALSDPSLETATGAQDTVQAIITGWTPSNEQHDYEAEEYTIDADQFAGDKIIQIDYDTYNLDLRALYDSLYASVDESSGAPDVIFIINNGIVVGSTSISTPAIVSGTWPGGVEPLLQFNAGSYAVGKGGNGGYGGTGTGQTGGTALQVTSAIRVTGSGTIGGGGGGGGGASSTSGGGSNSGGGGAGRNVGTGQVAGTLTTGGTISTGIGGDGGDLGQAGSTGTASGYIHAAGGAAGVAVDGGSLITYTTWTGSILGAQVG